MRSIERLEKRWETEDRVRLQSALERIETDASLRFFVRWLLEVCGHGRAPGGNDPLTLAKRCGMLAVAEQLVAEMDHTVPSLYPALVKETADERHARNAARNDRLAQLDDGSAWRPDP